MLACGCAGKDKASSFLIVGILCGTELRPKRDFAIQIRAYDATIHNYIQIEPE
jgi:hypothetical protein